MIEGLKPYPEMKDSGVLRLGEVPEHWGTRRLKTLCSRSSLYGANVTATSYATMGVRFLRTTDITDDGQLQKGGVFLPKELVVDYLLTDGDLLISRSGTVGRSFLYDASRHGHCAYAGYLVRFVLTKAVLPRYVFLYTKTPAFVGFLRGAAISSTIENVNGEKYANTPLPFPPLDEQAAIVRFLDHADRRIRRYISAKRKLIALLNEQKQAIIHKAVTRGLDPNVKLKPSGVEWLGEVPEHWREQPAKFYYREVDDRSAAGAEELLSVSHITGVTPRSVKNITMFMAESYAGHKLCRPGDLVINTMWAWMGALGVSSHTGIVSPAYGVYRPLRGSTLRPAYADMLLRTQPYVSEYTCRSTGIQSSRLRLYPEQFLRIKIACPPADEQEAIVAHVGAETRDADHAIQSAEREIDLLREYRTRLIADVVTGKLDVREAAAKLPDEAPDQEPPEPDTDDVNDADAAEPEEVVAEAEA